MAKISKRRKAGGTFSEAEKHRLALWIAEQRRQYKRGTLSDEKIKKLETLPNWTWDGSKDG